MLFRLHWGLPYRFAIVFFFTCGTFAMRHTTLTTVHPLTDVEWLKLGMYTDRIVSSDFSDRIQSDPIRPDPTNPTIRSDYPKLRMIFMYRWYAGLIASFWEKLMRRPTHHGGATSSRFYGVRWKGYRSRIQTTKTPSVVCFFPFTTLDTGTVSISDS